MPKIPERGIDCITPAEEAAFERKAERMLAGHRGLQNGRDYRWNVFRWRDSELTCNGSFNEKFDETFPKSPGSPEWWESRYCQDCGKVRSMCEC